MLYWLQRVEILTYILLDGMEPKGRDNECKKNPKNPPINQPPQTPYIWKGPSLKRRDINETWKIMS